MIVEYVLRETNKPIGIAISQIVSTLPQDLQNQISSPEQISKLLGGVHT